MDVFCDAERLYPFRSVGLSNSKLSFGSENTKLIKKILVLECQIFKKLLVLDRDAGAWGAKGSSAFLPLESRDKGEKCPSYAIF